jgi:hypothetical protein
VGASRECAQGRYLNALTDLTVRNAKPAAKIMALRFPRPGEWRPAEWSEIDLDKAVRPIPATRTMMRLGFKRE